MASASSMPRTWCRVRRRCEGWHSLFGEPLACPLLTAAVPAVAHLAGCGPVLHPASLTALPSLPLVLHWQTGKASFWMHPRWRMPSATTPCSSRSS